MAFDHGAAVFDLSVHQVAIRIGACLLVIAIHGLALAAIAWALGDRGPKFDGRLTANPFRHLDLIGTPVMILTQAGWIRPMVIDPAALRWGPLGLIICVLGSLAATLAGVALLLQLRIPVLTFLPNAFVPTIIATLNETVEVMAWFVSFNLMPLPPLTGMYLVAAIRPAIAPVLMRYQLYAALALGVLALTGAIHSALQPLRTVIKGLLPGLS